MVKGRHSQCSWWKLLNIILGNWFQSKILLLLCSSIDPLPQEMSPSWGAPTKGTTFWFILPILNCFCLAARHYYDLFTPNFFFKLRTTSIRNHYKNVIYSLYIHMYVYQGGGISLNTGGSFSTAWMWKMSRIKRDSPPVYVHWKLALAYNIQCDNCRVVELLRGG